jgi:ComF family protein
MLSIESTKTFDSGAWRSVLARAQSVARAALPQRCALCVADAGRALLCPACAGALPVLPSACPVCASPATGAVPCGACLAHPPPFAATVAAFVYAFPVDRLLQQLKYGGHLALADWAGAALARAAERATATRPAADRPDCIVALPLSRARQRERGFNQAQEIAARAARHLQLPTARTLARIAGGPPQAALSWPQRAANVRGAFAACGDVRGARIALVDDVMTTGATLAEAARTLVRAGAERVECWVVARTLRTGGA